LGKAKAKDKGKCRLTFRDDSEAVELLGLPERMASKKKST